MLDAPVSGGEPGAVNATLAIMVGGEEEVFEKMQDETVIIIDGNQAPEMMAEEIWQKIKGYLC